MTAHVVLAALGNEWRSDDGVGPAVLRRVDARLGPDRTACALDGPFGDPLDLLGCWDDAALAVVVDATRSGLAPGSVRCVDLDDVQPGAGATSSTHGLGLREVLRLARAVGRAPQRVVVVGVEGAAFGNGSALSPAVGAAVEAAADAVLALVREAVACA